MPVHEIWVVLVEPINILKLNKFTDDMLNTFSSKYVAKINSDFLIAHMSW